MSLMPGSATSTVGTVTEPATTTGPDETVVEDSEGPPPPGKDPEAPARRRTPAWLAPLSPAPIYIGITLTIAGFGLLAYTWSRVAGTAVVALQLPYVASGGFGGLGLVVIGLLVVNLGAKRRDAWQRDRRLEELAAVIDRRDEEPSA